MIGRLAVALTLFAPVPFAGPAAALDCTAPQTQVDMNACADRDCKKADKALNETYKALREKIRHNEDYTKALIAAQRAWITFRDANCDFNTIGSEGGTIRPLLVSNCQTEMTEHRTAALKKTLNCPAEDPACPLP